MKTILSFIATSWVLLEVLYTMIERYGLSLIFFDTLLGVLFIIGISMLAKKHLTFNVSNFRKSYKKILIVEDEPLVRELIQNKLKDEKSFRVTHEAKNGKEALSLLKNHKFDMVITDIDMPEMNGIELCKVIKRDYPGIKVLTLTMFNGTDQLKSIINSGASGYLDKEYMDSDIKSAINSVLDGGCYYSRHMLILFKQMLNKADTLNFV
ncbi:response regulator transcription factor [Reichenbachiella sp. MALMAid0571]|uniref:response regulator n=1 Tax=Reichenbachiella sp. MALMAid0571 TaxID=3143939 RepID=UPI0032DE7C15